MNIVGLLMLAMLVIGGCGANKPQRVKIGMVAPFEGRYREIGYDVIPAARVAIQEWAARAESKSVSIEIVAYDDMGDPALAVEQARKLAADPEVVIVIGHWREETTLAALPIYAEAGLPVVTFSTQTFNHAPGVYNLSPSLERLQRAGDEITDSLNLVEETPEDILESIDFYHQMSNRSPLAGGPVWGLSQFYQLAQPENGLFFVTGAVEPKDLDWDAAITDQFIENFKARNLDTPPGLYSSSGYEATWIAISIIAEQFGIEINNNPVDQISFDQQGRRIDAPVMLYQWQDGKRILIEKLH